MVSLQYTYIIVSSVLLGIFLFSLFFTVLRLHVKGAQQHLKPDCNSTWQNTWLYIKYWTVTFQQKWHFTLGKQKKPTNTVAYKPICNVPPSISSQNLVLKGLRRPTGCYASFFYCWVANYSNFGEKKEKKNKEAENSLVSLPPSHCRNFMPLISSFFNNQGLFYCCQLNGCLYVLHPVPTYCSLSLAVFCIHPFQI